MPRQKKPKRQRRAGAGAAAPRQPALASQETIAAIEDLHARISGHIDDIRRPESALISVAVIPALAMVLFLDPRSPLHSLYRQFYADLFEAVEQSAQVDPRVLTADWLQESSSIIADAISRTQEVANPLRQLAGRKTLDTDLDVLTYIDSNERLADAALGLKKMCASLLGKLNHLYEKTGVDEAWVAYELSTNADAYTLADVCQTAIGAAPHIDYFSSLFQVLPADVANEYVSMEFTDAMVWPKVFLAILGQKYIVDPFLQWLFPNGMVQKPGPRPRLPENLRFFTDTVGEELKGQLERREQPLAKVARGTIIASIFLWPFFLFLCLKYNDRKASPLIYSIFIFLTATVIRGMWHGATTYIQQRADAREFSMLKNLWQQIFRGHYLSFTERNSGKLATSAFFVNCKGFEKLSAMQTCKVIVNVLAHYGISLDVFSKKNITIPADASLDSKQIATIKANIEKALVREKNIKALKSQLYQLTQRGLCAIEVQPHLEENFLTTLDIYVSVPVHSQKIVETKFNGYSPRVEEVDDKSVVIKLRANSPLSREKFERLVDELQAQVTQAHHSAGSFDDEPAASTPRHRPKKSNTKKGPKGRRQSVKATHADATQTSTKRQINWPSASYDSAESDNEVKSISSSILPGYRHFALFRFKEEDFPTADAYEKFKEIITEDPKIVPPKGQQGLVYSAKMTRQGNKGPMRQTSLKAKALGDLFGDIRAYARSEAAPTGETLHVFDVGVEDHSHRR